MELHRSHKEVLIKKQLKCYIYIRVSTFMQVDGYSLDAQKDIDLLFCHRGLSCFVAFELKIGEFKLEYVGKIDK